MHESNDHLKALELLKLLVPQNKSQFRIDDDIDSDNWNDYVMGGEKVTIYDDKSVFKNRGKVFNFRGDVFKNLTGYKLITTYSQDAKSIVGIMDEMHFDIPARGRSLRDKTLINCFFN